MKRPWACGLIMFLAGASLAAGCGSGPAVTSSPAASATTRTGGPMKWSKPPVMAIDQNKEYTATIKTTLGEIEIQLLPKDAPITVNNFVFLARQGYYDGIKFHRVVRGFVIQAGDPTGTGAGGPGYQFADELPPKRPYDFGVVAMANAGPNTNGSQFFIGTGSQVKNLNSMPNYTIFGVVTRGSDVAVKINDTPVGGASGQSPLTDVRITGISIVEGVAK
jgi:cyclophilin family peptidyl-prolyl cis-trans isomerase